MGLLGNGWVNVHRDLTRVRTRVSHRGKAELRAMEGRNGFIRILIFLSVIGFVFIGAIPYFKF